MQLPEVFKQIQRLQKLRERAIARRMKPKAAPPRTNEPPPAGEKLEQKVARWYHDPVAFSREALGTEPWGREPGTLGPDDEGEGQIAVLRAMARKDRVAVRSGNKCGKTTTAAIVILWFVVTRKFARVVFTAPTSMLVEDVLWREVRRLYLGALIPLGGKLNLKPKAGLRYPDGRQVIGFSSDRTERVSGFSSPEILFVFDEASGIKRHIYEGLFGNEMGGDGAGSTKRLLISNPSQTSGEFYDSFHIRRSFYTALHLSSFAAARYKIPGCANQVTLDGWLVEYGRESPLYQVRVLGQFPTNSSTAVISLALLEAGLAAHATADAGGQLQLGVDVARFGDDSTIITPRRRYKIYDPIVRHGLDGPGVAGVVLAMLKGELPEQEADPEYAAVTMRNGTDPERIRVVIDPGGIGVSAVDSLKPAPEVELIECNASSKSDDEDEYHNMRAQLHFGLAAWLKDGGGIPRNTKLESEMVAAQYKFDVRGRRQVEPKEDIKARIGRSPDHSDSAQLAVYDGDAREHGGSFDTMSLDTMSMGFG